MGLAGFLATSIPVLWLGLGGIEVTYWMQLRQSLSLVLMDAARVGATRQAEPAAMAQALEQGLRKIYPAPDEVARILGERRRTLGLPWHIAIQSPTPSAFTDHADPDVQGPRAYPGQLLIRNEGQSRQHATRVAQGWPQGRGATSGLTIFEANTLRIALRWPHRPLLPGAGALLKALAPLSQDARNRQWMTAGYLPFRRMVAITMHSSPAAWPDLPDGRITHETGAGSKTGFSALPDAFTDMPKAPETPPGIESLGVQDFGNGTVPDRSVITPLPPEPPPGASDPPATGSEQTPPDWVPDVCEAG